MDVALPGPGARRRALGGLAIGWLAIAIVMPAHSALIEGVTFRDRLLVDGRTFELKGFGLLRYRVFFKAYVAALYLGEGVAGRAVSDDVPKRLELEYFWSIEGSQFGPAAEQILSRRLDAAAIDALRPGLDLLNAHYRSVKPGDRYALTYVPGRGTELSLNDEPLTVVPGSEFARHYFSIWLGEDPIDAELRDLLIGR